MTIRTEQEQNAEAIRYTQERIRELRRMIRECDYSEDVDGNLVYDPGNYGPERRELAASLREWERLLSLLTESLPCSFIDW